MEVIDHAVKKKLRIKIPAGVDAGTKVRVVGEGDVGLKWSSWRFIYKNR